LSLVTVAVLFFGIGVGAALAVRHEAAPAAADTSGKEVKAVSCSTIPADQVAVAAELAALLKNTQVARNLTPSDPASYSEMYTKARTDPVSRKELFERYREAPEGEAKQMLRSMLINLNTPDAVAFFTELAASTDAAQRRDGFEVLRVTGPKRPEVREVAMQALAIEQDPTILSNAIGALHPAVATPAENAAVLKQLREFSRHTDPAVRAQSIRGLAGWDKSGESVPVLRQALSDRAEEVRGAAVVGIIENRVRTDDLKQELMRIAHDRAETAGLRMNAVIALERFELSGEEHARIVQSATEADQLLASQDNQVR
jgi:hypothetical protein